MIAGAERPLALLTAESEQKLEALRRSLRRSSSFGFYVIYAAGAAQAEAIRRLRAWGGIGGIPEFLYFASGREAAPAIEEFLSKERRDAKVRRYAEEEKQATIETAFRRGHRARRKKREEERPAAPPSKRRAAG